MLLFPYPRVETARLNVTKIFGEHSTWRDIRTRSGDPTTRRRELEKLGTWGAYVTAGH